MDKAEPAVIEALPGIDIAVGADRVLFLERIGDLVGSSDQLIVERHQLSIGEQESYFINLILPGATDGSKSGGQLIVRSDEKRVCVEMHSADWEGKHPIKSAYIAYARQFFQPILALYNRQFGTRHRLRIVKAKGYVMPPKTKMLFDRFTTLANVRALHPLDWERFYLFVRNSRSEVPEGYLRPLLIKKGFSADKAAMLSELYFHLRQFKKLSAN